VITVTDRAKEQLKAMLIASGADANVGLRLLPAGPRRFVLALDRQLHNDLVIEYEGYKVLLVGIEYFKNLDGKTIDCQATEDGVVLFVQ
jgi:Fe-S cluster assembly iron-binding protein IscA